MLIPKLSMPLSALMLKLPEVGHYVYLWKKNIKAVNLAVEIL